MEQILDRSRQDGIAEDVLSLVEDLGYSAEEAIPGIIEAAKQLAMETSNPEQALNEAVRGLE